MLGDGISVTNKEQLTVSQLQITDSQTVAATIGPAEFTVRLSRDSLAVDITHMRHDYSAGPLQWLRVDHTIHSTATAELRQGQRFALHPGDGTHTVVVTKTAAADWVAIGLDTATLLLMTAGMAQGIYRTCKVGTAVETANTLTQTVELRNLTAMPEAEAAAESSSGATATLSAARGRAVAAKDFLKGVWQSYRATWFALIGTGTTFARLVMKVLEGIANRTSQNDLPNFNEFAAGVMAPVQWPNAQSEFNVTHVAFNGSFQIGGDPGFAD
jgi:hypothetical protein